MTKKKAFAIARELSTRCDEAHVFAVKIGAGVLCDVKCKNDGWELLSLFINLLERTINNLKVQKQDEYRKFFIESLQKYLEDDSPPKVVQENLSGKLLAKRIKNNEKIINALEELL